MKNIKNSTTNTNNKRATIFNNEITSNTSHLKTKIILLQKKYKRLQQKKRKIQIFKINS